MPWVSWWLPSPVRGPVGAEVQAPVDQPPDALRVLLLVHLLDGVSAALVYLRQILLYEAIMRTLEHWDRALGAGTRGRRHAHGHVVVGKVHVQGRDRPAEKMYKSYDWLTPHDKQKRLKRTSYHVLGKELKVSMIWGKWSCRFDQNTVTVNDEQASCCSSALPGTDYYIYSEWHWQDSFDGNRPVTSECSCPAGRW